MTDLSDYKLSLFDHIILSIIKYIPEGGESFSSILSGMGFGDDVHIYFEESIMLMEEKGIIISSESSIIKNRPFLKKITPIDFTVINDN